MGATMARPNSFSISTSLTIRTLWRRNLCFNEMTRQLYYSAPKTSLSAAPAPPHVPADTSGCWPAHLDAARLFSSSQLPARKLHQSKKRNEVCCFSAGRGANVQQAQRSCPLLAEARHQPYVRKRYGSTFMIRDKQHCLFRGQKSDTRPFPLAS